MDEKFLDNNLDASLAGQISFDGKDVLEIGSGSGGFTLKYLENGAVRPSSTVHRQYQPVGPLRDEIVFVT